jgi:hypothetical protein
MAVVFFAMGLYGCGALGATIRFSDDAAAVVKAKDLHPKLAIGMGLFFALGGVGGAMSLVMQVRRKRKGGGRGWRFKNLIKNLGP